MSQCTLTKQDDDDSGYGLSVRTSQQTDDGTIDLNQSCEKVAATCSGCPSTSLTTPSIAIQSRPPSLKIALKTTPLRVISKCIDEQIQTRAEDVIERISALLDEYMVKHKWKHISVAIRLAVLGTTEDDAKACLVVFCDDRKGVHARIRRFLRKTRAKELYRPNDMSLPRFDVLVAGPPTRNKGSIAVEMEWEYYMDQTNDTLCGMPIVFVQQPDRGRTLATMGGILQLKFLNGETQWYGLTAAHGAMPMATPDDKVNLPDDSSEDGESDTSSSISEQSSTSSRPSLPSVGFIDARCLEATTTGERHPWQSRAGLEATGYPFQLSTLYDIQDGHFRDWAIFPMPIEKCPPKANMYMNPNLKSQPLLLSLPSILNKPSGNRQVVIITGSSGPKPAILAPCLSRIRLTPGSKFVRAYTVQLQDASDVKQGDSGSWVIDPVSLEVYGHLIATDSLMGSYVIPMVDICEDIRNVFPGVTIQFPSPGSEERISRDTESALIATEPVLSAKEIFPPTSMAQDAKLLKADDHNEKSGKKNQNRDPGVDELVEKARAIRDFIPFGRRSLIGDCSPQSPSSCLTPPPLGPRAKEDFQYHDHLDLSWDRSANATERCPSVEYYDDQYVPSMGSIQEVLNKRMHDHADHDETAPETMTPSLRAFSRSRSLSPDAHAHTGPWQRIQRSTLPTLERKREQPSIHSTTKSTTASTSFHDSGIGADDDILSSALPWSRRPEKPEPTSADITPQTTRLLTPFSFTVDMLIQHLRFAEFDGPFAAALGEVISQAAEMDTAVSIRDVASYETDNATKARCGVYEVMEDASVASKANDNAYNLVTTKYNENGASSASLDHKADISRVWDAIKDINSDGRAVGRITIVQEPTPLMLAALLLTMSPHFDMPEILNHLISNESNLGYTSAFMNRAFEKPCFSMYSLPNNRQRSFFFVFKYYTSVTEGLQPASWQRFDSQSSGRQSDHIDIAECSSILALSLGGEPTKRLRRRTRQSVGEGQLFDTYGPWHILNIQSFPDNLHTVRGEEFQHKSFYNGPYAFLSLLVSEYKDAGKRNRALNNKITKLITFPIDFMFDRQLRDKLLFEDKHFTYIRRYFWAYNTLGVINTGIKAMISAYFDTFTDEFWSGSHPFIWPHPAPASPEGQAYKDKMAFLRPELERAIEDLKGILKQNEDTRKEIENLRDQLFSGCSIKESRRSIDQGDNIRILTMLSVLFLPLSFVTSVFGMTEFKIPATDWRFALTMVLVSLPFLSAMGLFQMGMFGIVMRVTYEFIHRIISFPYRVVTTALTRPDHRKTPGGRKTKRGDRRINLSLGAEKSATGSRRKWPWERKYRDEREWAKV